MAIEIASFPIKSGDFPVRDVNVYQRVCMKHRVKPQKNSVYTKITYIYIIYIYIIVFNEHGFWSPMYLQTLMFDKILYTVIFLTMLGFKY